MTSFTRSTIILLSIPFIATAATVPKDHIDYSGQWKNQRGSILVLKKEGSEQYSGTFATAVAQTKSCIGKPVPVHAVRNGNALSVSISLQACGSAAIVSMTGLVNENTMDTMSLTLFGGKEGWNSRVVTHDTFEKAH